MSGAVLFVDRDGTLVEEPADEQVDALAKVRFMPGVFAALALLRVGGFRLVIVTNQDGLGSSAYPLAAFEQAQRFILEAFASQGIEFEAVLAFHPLDQASARLDLARAYLAAGERNKAEDSVLAALA